MEDKEKVKIEVSNVSKTFIGEYGQRIEALRNVSFKVYEGEFLTVVGPSGCGKTTLLRVIAGLEKPDEGYVKIDGKIVDGPASGLGYIPQEFSLFPWRTVVGNIEFGLEVNGVPKAERKRIVKRLIGLVGLEGFEKSFPKELSGGMKQKVAIARALAIDPIVLLLDEPFANLDAQTRSYMQREFLRIWHEHRKTVIFVTHHIEEAVYLADRIILLSSRPGRVKMELKINLPRPRIVTSPEFVNVRAKLLKELEEDFIKTFNM